MSDKAITTDVKNNASPIIAKKEVDKPAVPWASARLLALGLLVYYSTMLYLMEKRLHWTPPVLPASAPPERFSEERAMAHVVALAGELPDRQISMPQLQKAHDYLERQGQLLAELAAARGGDVEVKVFRERVSGSIAMDFTGVPFTNAYRGLTNIVVTITPAAAAGRPGLLIAAHQDTAVAAPGASDDVSMVAVMLEAARTLLSRPTSELPAVPLVLLFDGGEESICQAGHGFFNSSAHARGLGAFINLEAMGAGGLPILFQHTGAWTVAAWARGAPNAHGARIAQDIFDTGLIPGDTDYRMFSARHYGTLPGLDIAFIRDSVAYHSALDNVERLRRGALQDMGEALLGGLMSVAAKMAADTRGELTSAKAIRERAVFFDLIGCGMITYPDHLAQLIHTAPLALFAMLPLASVSGGHTAAGVMLRMFAAAWRALGAFVAALVAPALLGVLRVLVTGVSMSWYAHHWVAYASFLPIAAAAALRPWLGLRQEALERRPLQQGHYVACQVYGTGLVLSGLAAGLCVAGLQGFSQIFAMGGMLGFALGSLIDNGAPTLTPLHAAGLLAVATVPLAAMSAILGTFLDVMMERMALTGHHSVYLADCLIGVLTGSAVLGYSCCCLLPLAGYALGGLADGGEDAAGGGGDKVGKEAALAAAAAAEGARRRRRRRRQAVLRAGLLAVLVASSLGAASWSAVGLVPYTPDSPRRVTITHLHETGSWVPKDDALPAAAARSVAAAAAAEQVHPPEPSSRASWEGLQERPPSAAEERRELASLLDPPPPIRAKLALGIVDSNTWDQIFADPAATPATKLPAVRPGSAVRYDALGHEYASLYPLDKLLGKLVLDAEPCKDPLVAVPPYVRKVGEELRRPSGGGNTNSSTDPRVSSSRVIRLRVFSEAHCWGMLNITAASPLLSWSLPSSPVAAPIRGSIPHSDDGEAASMASTEASAEKETGQPSTVNRRKGPPINYFHMIRFSHEDDSPFWDLWVEVAGGGGEGAGAQGGSLGTDPWVIVELSATYLPLTTELRTVRDAMPEWVTPTWIGTTYHSSYLY